MSAATVIVPTLGGERLARMLASVAAQTAADLQTIVVDNASEGDTVAAACERLDAVEVLRLERNAGYARAINLAAARADGDVIVLLNDDCVCEPEFVERIVAPIDPAAGAVMAAGVMRDWRDRSLIDSAGMELDRTLLVFDYLNGEPLTRLERSVADPFGPSGAAAAFDRDTFLGVGGFDERLFAYWEDVDLVLRLRRMGLRCALAPGAIGDHEHSATLGSGSARKNYLMGYGRGYVLRKWRVINARRLGPVLVREGVLCAGQALIDRNLAGVRGRVRGYLAAPELERYPETALAGVGGGALETLRRRAHRRARLRTRETAGTEGVSTVAFFHLAGTSGPSRSLENELAWLGGRGRLTTVIPGHGRLEDLLAQSGEVLALDYQALMAPGGGALGLARQLWRLRVDVRRFRRVISERRPQLVISVTSRLPAALVAARLERIPALVYCGELFGPRGRSPWRSLGGRLLIELTARLASGIVACSDAVARQFEGSEATVCTVYPPVGRGYERGDGIGLRERFGIAPRAPLIASVGYLTRGRGQDLMIQAMPSILERHPDARYLIAGDAFPRPQDLAYRERLLELIVELGLEREVIVALHVDEAADLYAAADVVVNPARVNESFGRVPFEAAVAGRPSVVTRVGAIPELLRDRESALIVSPDRPPELAAAVVRLLVDPELGRRLAAAARRIADERLAPEHSLAGFERAVVATLERGRE